MVIFDIPEKAKIQPKYFRKLLKQNNFVRLQNSVFISPYALNRRGGDCLFKTNGLIDYIRFVKAEELDMDRDLKKKFGLH